jgi:error-prone DNA polymerase
MVRRGYVKDFAERVFAQIEGFGSYGFPESHAASFAHLVYASAWMKRHHPGIFAAALLNSQPMGFYAPAQIVRDAREHGVAVRAVDVNASAWDCTLEAAPGSTDGLALRLGLRLVGGLPAEDGAAIMAARVARNGAPFASVEEVAWRAGVGKRALDALAAADGFAGLGDGRRQAGWAARGVAGGPRDLPLFAAMTDPDEPVVVEPAVALSPPSEGEGVVEDYRSTGLTLGRHPLALLRPVLAKVARDDTRSLATTRQGSSVRIAGLVLMRQRPGTAKGVVFLTIEDEWGVGNLVVYAAIAARDRAALIAGRMLVAEGRVERVVENAEVPITHLIVRRLIDRSDLLDGLLGGSEWVERAIGRADEVKRPDPGSRRPKARLPDSRDFR